MEKRFHSKVKGKLCCLVSCLLCCVSSIQSVKEGNSYLGSLQRRPLICDVTALHGLSFKKFALLRDLQRCCWDCQLRLNLQLQLRLLTGLLQLLRWSPDFFLLHQVHVCPHVLSVLVWRDGVECWSWRSLLSLRHHLHLPHRLTNQRSILGGRVCDICDGAGCGSLILGNVFFHIYRKTDPDVYYTHTVPVQTTRKGLVDLLADLWTVFHLYSSFCGCLISGDLPLQRRCLRSHPPPAQIHWPLSVVRKGIAQKSGLIDTATQQRWTGWAGAPELWAAARGGRSRNVPGTNTLDSSGWNYDPSDLGEGQRSESWWSQSPIHSIPTSLICFAFANHHIIIIEDHTVWQKMQRSIWQITFF